MQFYPQIESSFKKLLPEDLFSIAEPRHTPVEGPNLGCLLALGAGGCTLYSKSLSLTEGSWESSHKTTVLPTGRTVINSNARIWKILHRPRVLAPEDTDAQTPRRKVAFYVGEMLL